MLFKINQIIFRISENNKKQQQKKYIYKTVKQRLNPRIILTQTSEHNELHIELKKQNRSKSTI